jgi:FkbM family methyltransferase
MPTRKARRRRSPWESLARRLAERKRFASLGSWLSFLRVQMSAKHKGAKSSSAGVISLRLRSDPRPLLVRPGTSDGPVVKEIFLWDEYAPLLREVTGNVCTIIDLGSNIGLTVRLWQAHFPAARICAVEPDQGNAELLLKNACVPPLPAGGLPTLIRACIAGTHGSVTLDRSGAEWGFSMRRNEAAPGSETIEAITLDTLLERFNHTTGDIDILKCDIEGAESEVIPKSASWLPRVRHLAIELHEPYTVDAFLRDIEAIAPGRFVVTHQAPGSPNSLVFLKRKDA